MLIEANYEVIRFIEHGGRCRPAMDCVPGELLIYKVKSITVLERKILFRWIRQLLLQIQQYHRCHSGLNYRYVNPYSVLIAKDDSVLLLDMEAESNEFVLKNMQKRAMRRHFVKPAINIRQNTEEALDIFNYGKTIQFILANTDVEPSLSRIQENQLEKIIRKCLNENPSKQYQELKQIEKDLSFVREEVFLQGKQNFLLAAAAIGMSAALIGALFTVHRLSEEQEALEVQIWELEKLSEQRSREIEEIASQKEEDSAESAEEMFAAEKVTTDAEDQTDGSFEVYSEEPDKYAEEYSGEEVSFAMLQTLYLKKIELEAELIGDKKAKETVDEYLEIFPEGKEEEAFCTLVEKYHISIDEEEMAENEGEAAAEQNEEYSSEVK